MAAYRQVYDLHHLQADYQEPGSATEHYVRQSSIGYLYFFTSDYLRYLWKKTICNPLAHPTWKCTTLTCEVPNFFLSDWRFALYLHFPYLRFPYMRFPSLRNALFRTCLYNTCIFSVPVGPTQFTPPHQSTRHDKNCRACVVSGVAVWIGQLLLTCSDLRFSVVDSLESSRTQFTPPRQTRHRQDSFVGSGLAAWIGFNSRRLCAAAVA